ncbi:MAG: PQQ-binding-like beta-propeller repeat protein [Thermoplasmata archaeon]|nr:PQQ-binding-like beta-propeller repeat protein [Thermoplasmata archaeon]
MVIGSTRRGSCGVRAGARAAACSGLAVVAFLLVMQLACLAPGRSSGAASAFTVVTPSGNATLPAGGDSATYLTEANRSAYNPAETRLTPSNAAHIKQLWAANVGAIVYAQPALVNGTIYLPTWGGYLVALNATSGSLIYSSFLGTQSACAGSGTAGIASSPTVVGSTLYVGGASGQWLAVNAGNGSPLWNVTTGSPARGFYNWASPLLVGNEEYVGLASSCDHPLVPAAVLAINTTTHAIDGRFNTTLNGSLGASVWSSPAYDPILDEIFATTGNPSANSNSLPYSESILALSPQTLHLLGSWQIPQNIRVPDGDFGSTPTIVDTGHLSLVTALNKDGFYYAWNRSNISTGPVWKVWVGASPHDIAPSAYDGTQLYVSVGSNMRSHGQVYTGSLWAIDPSTGKVLWTFGFGSPAMTAPYVANGLVVVEAGARLYVVEASDGKLLRTLTTPSGRFINAPLISHGMILAGSSNGHLYAFGIPVPQPPRSSSGGGPPAGHSASSGPLLLASRRV